MCRELLHLLLHAPEMPNTKCMGKFATPVGLGHFDVSRIGLLLASFVLTESCSTHIKSGKLLNRLEVSST